MRRITTILAVAATFIISAHGQGFLNLNFESAYNLPYPTNEVPLSVSATNALPDWTAYNGSPPIGSILTSFYYVSNNFPGSSSPVELEGGSLALSGDFSIGLYGSSYISQTGLVPTNAESLEFEASSYAFLTVTLGGQNLSYSILSKNADYFVFGANVPAALDGQMETLTFGVQQAVTELDNIEFSTLPVPEPGESALCGVGAILFLFGRRKKRAP
jgi:hypothetical protein